MKDLVISNSLNLIRNNKPEYSDEKIDEIEYGLVGLYLMISKTIIICGISIILGIFKELIIFTLIYNVIRMPSFGLHASSSKICLIASTIMFIGLSYINTIIVIPVNIKIILGIIGIILIFKNSPADTEKRPIVNSKRRMVYKFISTIIAIIFVVLSVVVTNNLLSNCFLFALLLQCFMTAPSIYKLFGMPYDNYKTYIK